MLSIILSTNTILADTDMLADEENEGVYSAEEVSIYQPDLSDLPELCTDICETTEYSVGSDDDSESTIDETLASTQPGDSYAGEEQPDPSEDPAPPSDCDIDGIPTDTSLTICDLTVQTTDDIFRSKMNHLILGTIMTRPNHPVRNVKPTRKTTNSQKHKQTVLQFHRQSI